MIAFNPMSYLSPCCWEQPPMPWSWSPPAWTPRVSDWAFPPSFGGPAYELPPLETGPTSGNAHLDELRYQQRLLRRFTERRTPSELNVSTRTLLDNFETFDTAAGQGGGQDGIIGRPDLEAVAGDELADPALRKAARFMLNNPALRNAVDSANGTGYDDRFNREELEKSLATFAGHEDVSDHAPMDERRTASVLSKWVRVLDGAAGGEVDGRFGRDDLQAVWDSPDASPELRRAAFEVLHSQTRANRFDSANGALDGVYSDADLQRVLSP